MKYILWIEKPSPLGFFTFGFFNGIVHEKIVASLSFSPLDCFCFTSKTEAYNTAAILIRNEWQVTILIQA
jgi:hypothetical protein